MATLDLEAAQATPRLKLVGEFRDALAGSQRFSIADTDLGLVVASKTCAFQFGFERRSATRYTLMVTEPSRPRDGMAFFVLRQILGARGPTSTPTELASLVNTYFASLLEGDFSVRKDYRRLETPILDGMLKAHALPDDHPVNMKIANCDLSWLEDVRGLA